MSPKIDYFVRQSRQKVETSDFDKDSKFHKFSQFSWYKLVSLIGTQIAEKPYKILI